MAYFQENIGHFDIHALTLRKIKRKWKKFSFEENFFYIRNWISAAQNLLGVWGIQVGQKNPQTLNLSNRPILSK